MSGANPPRIYDADFEEVADQRRGGDRRASDRRVAASAFDTLFAATLVNRLSPTCTAWTGAYRPTPRLRAGIAFDLRA